MSVVLARVARSICASAARWDTRQSVTKGEFFSMSFQGTYPGILGNPPASLLKQMALFDPRERKCRQYPGEREIGRLITVQNCFHQIGGKRRQS